MCSVGGQGEPCKSCLCCSQLKLRFSPQVLPCLPGQPAAAAASGGPAEVAAALGGVSLEDLSAALHERTPAVMKLRVSVVGEAGLLTWLTCWLNLT